MFSWKEIGRKPNRLPGYDYSTPGYYFVTSNIWDRREILGTIHDGIMQLSPCGDIVLACWTDLPNHYRNIRLDEFVVMPNHIHGLIQLTDPIDVTADAPVREGLRPSPTIHPVTEHLRALKSFSARAINAWGKGGSKTLPHVPRPHGLGLGIPVWQRGFHDTIVRTNLDLDNIREYIRNNPTKWETDRMNITQV